MKSAGTNASFTLHHFQGSPACFRPDRPYALWPPVVFDESAAGWTKVVLTNVLMATKHWLSTSTLATRFAELMEEPLPFGIS